MATPTRSQAVSTPKSHLSNTPSRPLASPRPGTSTTAQKSLAYKSPAVKTPASAHGHAHSVSLSSQPTSTPLAAAAIHDELLNLNSPTAALMNSIAATGLTPLSSGQDGLGITPHPQGLPGRDRRAVTTPEAERLQRLQQVVSTLRTKVVGRGISREGVERAARIQGFEALWDENNLTIAGNIVELDVSFDPLTKDKVRDLVLKLSSADGESHIQQEATNVLKGGLGADSPSAPAEDLHDFSLNLQYLAQMDRVNTSPNAFEIMGSLYKTFRDIWDEEKKRMKWRNDIHHFCKGSIGQPHSDRKPRLGISVNYWKNKHVDGATNGPVEDVSDPAFDASSVGLLQARLLCEGGNPSISSSLEWLLPNVLEEKQPDNVLNSGENLQRPAWLEPATMEPKASEGDLDIDQVSAELPKSLNAHFMCELDPEILVPLNTALRMTSGNNMIDIDQERVMTFPRALQNARNAVSIDHKDNALEARWSRRLPARGSGANICDKTHSYALYSAAPGAELWGYPLSQMRFSHPRELASLLPILRQHAVLWALMRNLVINHAPVIQPLPTSQNPIKRRVFKRSNARSGKVAAPNGATERVPKAVDDILNVDVSLDAVSEPGTCKLEIFAPLHRSATLERGSSFIHLSVMIGLNGKIDVTELTGAADDDSPSLKRKLGRMLSLTEDIGMVLEWFTERVTSVVQT